jgi:sarcosine oxidase subunit alpha
MRIAEHPILELERKKQIKINFEGKTVHAFEGETIAAALYASGLRVFSWSEKKSRARGFFCAIGKCSSCLMEVNGMPNVRTCITLVADGMKIKRQHGWSLPPRDMERTGFNPPPTIETDVLVIGGGPAGLKAATAASSAGAGVILVDENPYLGGQLLKQTHKFFGSQREWAGVRGIRIAKELREEIENNQRIRSILNASAVGIYEDNAVGVYKLGERMLLIKPRAVICATGAKEKTILFDNNDYPGVYGAGGIQTLMNQFGVKPGQKLLMVGAGNVGLIVSYQLLQAGIKVVGVVEALPRIGGYFVHAAKLRRQGVPILTSHTILRVDGREKVENAVIARIGDDEIVEGSEKKFEVDAVALACGLSPDCRLLQHAECKFGFAPELGGMAPLRDENLETSRRNLWVAGDSAGIEEATTAMLEGEIAGICAAQRIGYRKEGQVERLKEAKKELEELREGPFCKYIRQGLKRVMLPGGN